MAEIREVRDLDGTDRSSGEREGIGREGEIEQEALEVGSTTEALEILARPELVEWLMSGNWW